MIFQLSDTIRQVKTYMIPFLKQAKYSLKKSHGNDFLNLPIKVSHVAEIFTT